MTVDTTESVALQRELMLDAPATYDDAWLRQYIDRLEAEVGDLEEDAPPEFPNLYNLAIHYQAEPTCAAFHACDLPVRVLMGPFGSGKSVACVNEVFRRVTQQAPAANGVRYSRWAIIRNTYPQLRSTTIRTWQEWIPDYYCRIVYTAPITGIMRFPLADGTRVDALVYFLALDRPQHLRNLLSLELTGAWINEAREVPQLLWQGIEGRLRRYPPKRLAPLNWSGLIADTNPPSEDSALYSLMEEQRPPTWGVHKQPPALLKNADGEWIPNPLAENVQHQPAGIKYWLDMVHGKTPDYIRVYVLGEYGHVFSGKPVYEGVYNDQWHVSPEPLQVYRGLPLHLWWDFGLTPACLILQCAPSGQWRLLRECLGNNTGLKQFIATTVRPLLNNEFSGMSLAVGRCDPAGAQRSQADETTCLEVLRRSGFPTLPAPTNDFLPRRDAVTELLLRTIAAKPGFIIDPSCKVVRKGFLGGYAYARIQVSGADRYHDRPEKNAFSHPHDALQSGAVSIEGMKRKANTPPAPVQAPPRTAWAGST